MIGIHIFLPFVSLFSYAASVNEKIFCNCTEESCRHPIFGTGVCETLGGCQKTVTKDLKTNLVTLMEIITSYISPKLKINNFLSCISENNWTPPERPLMCHAHRDLNHVNGVGCCRTSFCAPNLVVDLAELNGATEFPASPPINDIFVVAIFIVASFLIGLIAVIGCSVLFLKRRSPNLKWLFKRTRTAVLNEGDNPLMNGEALESYQTHLNSAWAMVDPTSSGSGQGAALLVQRTIARQITLEIQVGKGRFGEVWRGNWRGDHVAVKIFSSRDEKSWFREVDIYQTALLHDDNLLKFIASDNIDDGRTTQLWLITQYHPHGSLYDFLVKETVPVDRMCRMAQGIAAGLAFLHKEVVGTSLRPAIAHRDIKSKNILVKNDFSCCLGDLGLAVRYDSQMGTIDVPDNNKVGTRRYLAPEVLDDTMNINQFDSYRRSDIYSLGLVLWELCRRTDKGGTIDPFEVAYYEYVPADPSLESMKQCVCVEKRRPSIPNSWYIYQLDSDLENDVQLSEILQSFIRLMQECWSWNPEARLTALR
uniref:receptor protein serine/threonine kinase n=1 Tax=Romanomermis culicivorax TaxID=13658 RepID=A0A915KCD7_ROMCU